MYSSQSKTSVNYEAEKYILDIHNLDHTVRKVQLNKIKPLPIMRMKGKSWIFVICSTILIKYHLPTMNGW